jgi:hypothetical protein
MNGYPGAIIARACQCDDSFADITEKPFQSTPLPVKKNWQNSPAFRASINIPADRSGERKEFAHYLSKNRAIQNSSAFGCVLAPLPRLS